MVRLGLRTLVKHGDPDALALIGVSTDLPIELTGRRVDQPAIRIGGTATLRFTIYLPDSWYEPAYVVIDYRVHYQGTRGPNAPKVFKFTRRRLAPGETQTLTRRHRFEHVSIREIRPGPHLIDVQLNGRVAGSVVVDIDN